MKIYFDTSIGRSNLSNLKEQHEQNRCTDRLEQHKSNQHLSIRPPFVMAHVIMKRVAYVLEDWDLEKSQHHDLHDTGRPVN